MREEKKEFIEPVVSALSRDCLVDGVSFTLPRSFPLNRIFDEILLVPRELFVKLPRTRYGYRTRYSFMGSISVLTDGSRKDMGHEVHFKGEGCGFLLERMAEIAEIVIGNRGHITMVDLCAARDYKNGGRTFYLH
jgi:hypothetical protein